MFLIDRLKDNSIETYYNEFASLVEYNPCATLLDVGCGDGQQTIRWVKQAGTENVMGIDALDLGFPFQLLKQDIDKKWPFKDGTMDVVIACHVIEHVSNTDQFASEIYRVLKPGGYAVIGTPNMASGRTIVALLLDRQPHIAYISDYFVPRRRLSESHRWEDSLGHLHRRLFTLEGLFELFAHYGFEIEHKRRLGYGRYFFGKILRGRYAANLLMKVRKV